MEMVKLSFDKDLRDAATNVSHLSWRELIVLHKLTR